MIDADSKRDMNENMCVASQIGVKIGSDNSLWHVRCLVDTWGPLLLTWINFNLSIIKSNHMPSKLWDEITYPFPNVNGCTVEVKQWISHFIPTHFNGCNYS